MVIANSCAGAFSYSDKDCGRHKQYDNPFIGCTIFEKSFYLLIKNFDKIDFTDYSLGKALIPINYNISNVLKLMGGKISIFFIHYSTLDIVKERWDSRVVRLQENLKDPNWKNNTLFVYNSYRKYFTKNNEGEIYRQKILNELTEYNILADLIYENKDTYTNNVKIYPNKGYKHYNEVSNYIVDNYPQYLP